MELHIVAHEDDDLLFMNPDVATSIANGGHVVTVFLTAGSNPCDDGRDAYAGTVYSSCYDTQLGGYNGNPETSASYGGEQHFIDRELGVLNAYAFMAGPKYAVTSLADAHRMLGYWRISAPTLGSKQVVEYDFIGDPAVSISLVFLRMYQEGGGPSSGDLDALWNGTGVVKTFGCDSRCPLGADVPVPQTYASADEIVTLLAALMHRFQSAVPGSRLVVSTQDSSWLYTYASGWNDTSHGEKTWVDATDHVRGAQFAITAFHRYHQLYPDTGSLVLREYRGYDATQEPVNLSKVQIRAKARVFYRNFIMRGSTSGSNGNPDHPSFGAGYNDFLARTYAIDSLASAHPLRGRLVAGGQCLRHDGGALHMGGCEGAPQWQITTRDEIHLASDPARCLELDANDTASLASCRPTEAQTFVATTNGQIRTRGARCLSGADGHVRGAPCAGTYRASRPLGVPAPGENWTLLSDPL